MSEQPQTGADGQQAVEYDAEHVVAALRGRLVDLVGRPAADAMVEAARLDAITRALAAQNATLAAQLAELRRTTAPGGAG